MLRSFSQNNQLPSNFAGKFKIPRAINTSSTRKRVHQNTRKNALACASSLYWRNIKTRESSLYAIFTFAAKFRDDPKNENPTMTPAAPFRAIVVSDQPHPKNPTIKASLTTIAPEKLADAEVRVRVDHSAINYKDVLAVQAHPGVAKKLPLIPGIDATGTVVESNNDQFNPGDKVLIAHAKFGTESNGGLAEYCQVPGDWLLHLPSGMSTQSAAVWGTAGFTAAQSVDKLLQHNITPVNGPVIVSGATGGVGIFSVMILHKLGFEVAAITGKDDQHEWLQSLGASSIIRRSDFAAMLDEKNKQPLLKSQYAAAIDTVGGATLGGLLKTVQPHGIVTACGMVGGNDLSTTVFPFILRGLTLSGIDSAGITRTFRQKLWNQIADQWQVDLTPITKRISLDEVFEQAKLMSQGKTKGRLLVDIGTENNAAT